MWRNWILNPVAYVVAVHRWFWTRVTELLPTKYNQIWADVAYSDSCSNIRKLETTEKSVSEAGVTIFERTRNPRCVVGKIFRKQTIETRTISAFTSCNHFFPYWIAFVAHSFHLVRFMMSVISSNYFSLTVALDRFVDTFSALHLIQFPLNFPAFTCL